VVNWLIMPARPAGGDAAYRGWARVSPCPGPAGWASAYHDGDVRARVKLSTFLCIAGVEEWRSDHTAVGSIGRQFTPACLSPCHWSLPASVDLRLITMGSIMVSFNSLTLVWCMQKVSGLVQ